MSCEMIRSSRSYRSLSAARAGAQQQTRRAATAAVDRRDRQTDGRTPDRFMTALAAYCEQPVIIAGSRRRLSGQSAVT